MPRVFMTMDAETFDQLEKERTELGMNRSQYVRRLMSQRRGIRPASVRYRELIGILSRLEMDLKVIALKEELSDSDRLLIRTRLEELIEITEKHYGAGSSMD